MRLRNSVILALFSFVLFCQGFVAGTAILSWNAPPDLDLAGYRLYYGTASHTYGLSVNVGNVTTYTLSTLPDTGTFYFAVTAYDTSGNESGFSNEVSKTFGTAPPPTGSLILSLSFDEGSGTTVSDSLGNVGTVSGAAWTAGKYGQALSFDGNDYVSLTSSSLPSVDAAQTISFWFSSPAFVSSTQIMVISQMSSGGASVQAEFRSGKVGVGKWGGTNLVSVTQPTNNVWHHFAYTFDGATHRLYLDGAEVNSSTVAPQTGKPSKLYIGTYSGLAEYFQGKIDNLRMYSKALSASEVQTDMQSPISGGVEQLAPPTTFIVK